jgi:CRP-like cAMP-binding protein
MQAFKLYLQQFPNYIPEVFDAVLPFLSSRSLSPGEYFLREGKRCNEVALIVKGMMRLYYLADGKEVTNCFCREGSLSTSYTSLITKAPSEVAIQAVEPTDIITLSADSLDRLYDTSPFWQQLGRMAAQNELIINQRHNRFLRHVSATDRYKQVLTEDAELLQRVPLNYLATYLQVSPETLSRIRKKLSRT